MTLDLSRLVPRSELKLDMKMSQAIRIEGMQETVQDSGLGMELKIRPEEKKAVTPTPATEGEKKR